MFSFSHYNWSRIITWYLLISAWACAVCCMRNSFFILHKLIIGVKKISVMEKGNITHLYTYRKIHRFCSGCQKVPFQWDVALAYQDSEMPCPFLHKELRSFFDNLFFQYENLVLPLWEHWSPSEHKRNSNRQW